MCWVGRCDVKIAKRDFYVYKIGRASDKGFKSLYQNFIYEPKEINKKVELNPIQFFKDESSYVIYGGIILIKICLTLVYVHIIEQFI